MRMTTITLGIDTDAEKGDWKSVQNWIFPFTVLVGIREDPRDKRKGTRQETKFRPQL